MKTLVLYHSISGNTKKVAESMARAIDCECRSITEGPINERVDTLFLGGAVYATYDHSIAPDLRSFIASMDPRLVGRVYLFCTGFVKHAVITMGKLLEEHGIKPSSENFFCKGKLFVIFNFGHPNKSDLRSAAEYAKKMCGLVIQ